MPNWNWGGGGNERSRESQFPFRRHLLPAPLLRGIVGASASRSLREVSLLFPLPSPKVGVKRVRVRVGGRGCRCPPRAGQPPRPRLWAAGGAPSSLAPARPCRLLGRCVCLSRPSGGGRHVRRECGGGAACLPGPARRRAGPLEDTPAATAPGAAAESGVPRFASPPHVLRPGPEGAGAGRARYTRAAARRREEGGGALEA